MVHPPKCSAPCTTSSSTPISGSAHSGADHDLPHHLPIRPVHLEAEHVGRLILISELKLRSRIVSGLDEGHGDLADSFEVEAQVGERSGEEAGGSSVSSRRGPPRPERRRTWAGQPLRWLLRVWSRPNSPPLPLRASPEPSGYSMRGPRKPMSDSRMASPASWISCMVSWHSSNWPSCSFLLYGIGDDVLDTLRGRLRQGLHGRLYGVGEHHDAGLLATWAGRLSSGSPTRGPRSRRGRLRGPCGRSTRCGSSRDAGR